MNTEKLYKELTIFCKNKGLQEREAAYLLGLFTNYAEALRQPLVSGSLPMYDVEELNEIVKELNSGKLSLFDFVGKIWNKAYILGCIDGSKGNNH